MGIHDLTVDTVKSQLPHMIGKSDEGSFACIGFSGKHGLAEKHGTQGNTIETTDQFTLLVPCLHAVGASQPLKAARLTH